MDAGMRHKKFTKKQINQHCTELYRTCIDHTKDYGFIYKIIRDFEIELLHVSRSNTRRFWLASVRSHKNDGITTIHYEHDKLNMAILGAYLWMEGYRP